MITNSTLLQINRRTGVSAASEDIITPGSPLVPGMSCMMDGVSSSQKFTLGAQIEDSSNSLYIDKCDFAAAGVTTPIANGDQLTIAIEGEASKLYQVLITGDRVLGLVSHYELFLKVL